MIVKSFAPAKINLTLHVGAPRAGGFHPLDSLVVFADVGDVVTARVGDDLSLTVSGPFSPVLERESDNLVLRAARAFAAHAEVPACAALHLDKHLPLASGIGGGSTDAAATLRVLNRLWGVGATEEDLERLAVSIGADVPVCIRARAVRMRGIGEDLNAATLPDFSAVLVNPMAPSPTGQVFRAFDAAGLFGDLAATEDPPPDVAIDWLRRQRNDLTVAAQQVSPPIGDALRTLANAAPDALVRMSGSGATCFALVADGAAAQTVAAAVRIARPSWWVRAARLGAVDVGVVEG